MAVIEVRGLSKRFGAVQAVDGLSFDADAGAVTGFLGPNGAGALIRNQIAAIVGALVFEIGIDGILSALLPDVGKFLPGSAAAALAGSGGGSQVVLPTALGALVLLGYLAVATGLGSPAVVRRDVNS